MADSQLPQRWIPQPVPPNVTGMRNADEHESTLKSVLQLVALLRRHWLLIFAIAAASVAIQLYRVRNDPHIYRATATLRLEDKGQELANGMTRTPMPQPYRSFYDPVLTQLQVLQSQAVAESVASAEGLRLRSLPRWLPPNSATSVCVSPAAPSATLQVACTDSAVLVRSPRAATQADYGMPVSIGGIQFTVERNPGVRAADLTVISAEEAANECREGLSGR